MNILSSKQFENRLAENTFSETSKYRVLLASQLIFWFSFFPGEVSAVNYTFLTTTIKTLYFILVFIGIKNCYSINKRIDGTGFIERFTLLFFPIGLKFLLFAPIICIVIFGILYKLLRIWGISSSFIKAFIDSYSYYFSFFMISTFYFMLYRSFLRLEQKIKQKQSTPPA